MTQTDLDIAFAAMDAAPADDALRLRFYERLADSELFLLLTAEPHGDQIEPEMFEVEDQTFVLAFDREERLAEFAGRIVPMAALSGRSLVAMLAPHGIGLTFNPDVAPSTMLIPAEAVAWMAEILSEGPAEIEERPVEFNAPRALPEVLLSALDRKLAMAGFFASHAYLAEVGYESGARGHLIGFTDVVPGAERALANAVREALVFSGLEAGSVDVTFLSSGDPALAPLQRVALRFDLPQPEAPAQTPGAAPGMDPARPPRLR